MSTVCDQSQACICTPKKKSLDNLWNKKFDSRDVLDQIKLDKKLTHRVTQLLRNKFLRTGEQSKQDLESILPDHLLKKLQPKHTKSLANKENLDLKTLHKHVTLQVKSAHRSSPYWKSTYLDYLNWVKNFFKFLKENKHDTSIQNVYHQVRLTEDELLQEYLDRFFKKYNVKEEDTTPEYQQDTSIQQIVTNMVIDRMINEIGIPKTFPSKLPSFN